MAYQQLTVEGTRLSALYRPPGERNQILVFAHGAGANLAHQHMTNLADALGEQEIGTLRFNFPFIAEGRRQVDSKDVCIESITSALDQACQLGPGAQNFLADHSLGGRMASHLMAETNDPRCRGLVFFSFPLHVSKKPDVKRAAHLGDIKVPMLIVSGNRDTLAEIPLLKEVTGRLASTSLHWLETADHSFKILKRSRQNPVDVYNEVAIVVSDWLADNST